MCRVATVPGASPILLSAAGHWENFPLVSSTVRWTRNFPLKWQFLSSLARQLQHWISQGNQLYLKGDLGGSGSLKYSPHTIELELANFISKSISCFFKDKLAPIFFMDFGARVSTEGRGRRKVARWPSKGRLKVVRWPSQTFVSEGF